MHTLCAEFVKSEFPHQSFWQFQVLLYNAVIYRCCAYKILCMFLLKFYRRHINQCFFLFAKKHYVSILLCDGSEGSKGV